MASYSTEKMLTSLHFLIFLKLKFGIYIIVTPYPSSQINFVSFFGFLVVLLLFVCFLFCSVGFWLLGDFVNIP